MTWYAQLAIYAPLFTLLLMVLRRTYALGRTAGENRQSLRQMKQDFQELHKAMSAMNDANDRRYRQLYDQHIRFRIKVAAFLGLNGD